ncbi:MAG: hypothetical protein JOZ57_00400, partial [Abitibacteriaceae bacterium]|nr:hypothetical protein [Abditibacteriaceae bacterium]
MSPILSLPGVCVFPERPENAARGVAYPHYIYQVLTHAGVAYCKVEPDDLGNSLAELSLLVTIGEASLSSELQDSLRDWVHSGGAWLSIAGLCGLEDLFGVSYAPPAYSGAWGGNPVSTLGEGYLTPDAAEHPVLAHLNIPLHFFNGLALQAGPLEPEHSDNNASKSQTDYLAHSLDAHGRETTRIALAEHKVGKGRCLVLAPDAIGAVVRIQQGVTVTRDGVPAPDGTAPVSDGVLKCGDGGVLDWYFDRQDIPGVPGLKGFLEPIADQWRELVLRALFYLGAKQGTSFPVLWLYPRNLPALGHLSLDTDHNDPALGAELLRVLAEASVPATWCVIAPGYEHNLLQKIEADRHELAMHYDAMSQGCPWSEELFEKQWQYLSHLFGEQPVTNKNHYTRWEGDTEFFDWCSKRAIELDQSKGPSKTGEVGFPF